MPIEKSNNITIINKVVKFSPPKNNQNFVVCPISRTKNRASLAGRWGITGGALKIPAVIQVDEELIMQSPRRLLVIFSCSLLFAYGVISVLGMIPLYSAPSFVHAVYPYLLVGFSVFWVGWSLTKSIPRALIGLVFSTVGGWLFISGLVGPGLEKIFSCCPDLLVIVRYGIYDVVLWIGLVIAAVLIISDYRSWKGIVLGGLAGLIIVTVLEILLVRLGQSSDLGALKLLFYTPFLWAAAEVGRERKQ